MERKDCSEMSNSDLKAYISTLENEFEAKKSKMKEICNELKEIEDAYNDAQNEIKIRRTVF